MQEQATRQVVNRKACTIYKLADLQEIRRWVGVNAQLGLAEGDLASGDIGLGRDPCGIDSHLKINIFCFVRLDGDGQ